MNEIRILHMFPELLSLYGEYANLTVLANYLNNNGINTRIDYFCGGELRFEDYDLIYMGCGTEENIEHAIKLLAPTKNNIKNAIENNQLFLVTGNSIAMFGNTIKNRNNTVEALGIFPFDTQENEKRYIGDIITEPIFDAPAVGFINSSYVINGIASPWFYINMGKNLGNDKNSCAEGLTYKNFYATSLIGPLLTKNPHILEFFIEQLTKKTISIPEDDNIKKAYRITLNKLNNTAKLI